MPTSDLIFIIGRQRSGTTVFRDMLARHGAIDCDEIFHGQLGREHRFYDYILQRMKSEPHLVHPEHHARLFHEYIEAQRKAAGGRKLAMDVKYFGLNLIPLREDVDNRTPYIINFMRYSQAHVVHIIRRNKLRVHVSEEMAKATGRWSAGRVDHLVSEKPKLTLDIAQTLGTIDRLIMQDDRVKALLDTIPTVARLHYDEMFDASGLFTKTVQQVAARFLDIEAVDPKPGNLKMNPEPLAKLVANYDDVAKALDDTHHAWMLSDSN